MSPNPKIPLIEATNLSVHFPVRRGLFGSERYVIKAVNNVSLTIAHGEIVGVVGESGCGKTTLGRTLLRLIQPTNGTIDFLGDDITHVEGDGLMKFRRLAQIVFQDPFSSMNPRMIVGDIVAEPLVVHRIGTRDERQKKVIELLANVGFADPRATSTRYPHEFSGGQRQRICIARALALDPSFIVCDEPTSALDVSVRAQIINLLMKLTRERGLTLLFISHDLPTIERIADRIAVMYFGEVVETGVTRDVIGLPRHPYTQTLMAANPIPDPNIPMPEVEIIGEPPDPKNPPTGCHFHPRCPQVDMDRCSTDDQQLIGIPDGREVACWKVTAP